MSKSEKKLKAVYTGRRLIGSKIFQRFEHSNGTERYFRGIRRVWVGYSYYCNEDSIASKPERTNDERIDNAEWEIADELVSQYLKQRKSEQALEKQCKPHIRKLLQLLKPLVEDLNYYQTKALIEHLVCELKFSGKSKVKGEWMPLITTRKP